MYIHVVWCAEKKGVFNYMYGTYNQQVSFVKLFEHAHTYSWQKHTADKI